MCLSWLCLSWLFGAALAPAQIYNVSTFAGGAPIATPASALQQTIEPSSIVTDAAGNFYFTSDNSVYRVDSKGTLTRVAGNGRAGYSGDGGPALSAQLNHPSGLAFDGAGNLLIGDPANFRVRRVSTTGIITTIAGNGTRGNAGDEGPAVNAQLDAPTSVVSDAAGNVYIGDNNYQGVYSFPTSSVRRVSPDGVIHRVAAKTTISGAAGLAIDQAGNLLIADIGNSRVLKVLSDGTAVVRYSGRPLVRPYGLAVDSSGNIFIGDQGQLAQCGCYGAIREVLPDGTLVTLAGGGQLLPPTTPAANTRIQNAAGVVLNGSGLLIADGTAVLALADGQSSVVAGSTTNLLVTPAGDGGAATNAQLALLGIQGFAQINCVAVDRAGNVYIAENSLGRIRKVSGGIITTFTDQLNGPAALAMDAAGNLYVNEAGNAQIRRISTTGSIATVLRYGPMQYSVYSMAIDDKGNIFFTDSRKYVVRKLATDGTLTVIAGTGESGFSGDGGPATQAQLYDLRGIALDSSNIYFADGNRVRKVSADGIITTVAGGDTAPIGATGLVTDNLGNLFAVTDGNYVKKISPGGAVTTIVGVGTAGYSGDGGPGTNAQLAIPGGLAIDATGNLYIADTMNNAVRLLHPTGLPIEISAIVDAATETATPVSPGRIVVIYGAGLGPAKLAQFSVSPAGTIATQLAGTMVTLNGAAAPILHTSASQVAAIVPYSVSGFSAQVRVTYQGASADFNVLVTPAAPTLFTANETGAGQAAAVNLDGAINSASRPVRIGSYISLYATGEGQTTPAGADGKLAGIVLPSPNLPVIVTIGGLTAPVTYAGAAPGEVAGLMQINVIVPDGVEPGGYVPVSVRVGAAESQAGVTIAVAR